MNYRFPIIGKLDDVRFAIQDSDEFIIAEREYGYVVNYNVQKPDTFPHVFDADGSENYNAMIRRECRGLIFDRDDEHIISRPFHKFFNLNERPETLQEHVPDFFDLIRLHKLDGSMIRPIPIKPYKYGDFRLGTKMGITDVAMMAETFICNKPHYIQFMKECIAANVTPIFEYIGPKNRIVLQYPKEDLVLLAMRKNFTGEYLTHNVVSAEATCAHITYVEEWAYDPVEAELVNTIREETDSEGYVFVHPDTGHRLKIKNDWYVALHKAKEAISREKYVLEMMLNDGMDDLKPRLMPEDLAAVEKFEHEFWDGLHDVATQLASSYREVTDNILVTGDETQRELKKMFVETVDHFVGRRISGKYWANNRPLLFKMFDNMSRPELFHHSKYSMAKHLIMGQIKKSLGSQTSVDNNRHLWNGAIYRYGAINE